jgi:hypothetical protein
MNQMTNHLPFNLCIESLSYENDDEYRAAVKLICFLCNSDLPDDDYDTEQMTKALDYIWENTRNNSTFMELYTLAASQMMTEEATIGLAILFSYDYLKEFYLLCSKFLSNPAESCDDHPCYLSLKTKLTTK